MTQFNLDFISSQRAKKKLSLQAMAVELGFKHASTYMKYEKGEYLFKAEQLPKLASVLDCKVSDFFKQNVAKTATKSNVS
ncbi:helix-turn-helix domain-containing protein [Jeotgalibacillus campisalis]|uniref:HTH cro/C1-type domain-containing protein n=1 Tax=Jeotgalibacillus campisalis TaxID=220754 RepID=A0A0C2VP18_9BACL|nr:helix-turn-helix transcriptional regulator [Jeotgalibacillus campisalis]KIL46196.1 hypothetical protein KR50_28710 [Jeotgalibacillus campisalis]